MEVKKFTGLFIFLSLGIYLLLNLQQLHFDNIYYVIYSGLLFAIFFILKYRLSNELLNGKICYLISAIISFVTVATVLYNSHSSLSFIITVKSAIAFLALTFLAQRLLQIIFKEMFKLNFFDSDKKLSWTKSFLIIIIGWILYLVPFLPGNIAGDGNFQLTEFFGYIPLTNHHPLLTTLLEGGIYKFGMHFWGDNAGLLLFVIVQMIICALIYSFCIASFNQFGLKHIVGLILSLFVGLMPYWSFLSETLHKDALFIAFFALFVDRLLVLILNLFINHNKINAGQLIVLTITGLLVCLWRNDGLYMVLPSIFLLVFVAPNKYRKGFAIVFATTLLFIIGWNKVALPAMHVAQTEKREMYSLPCQQTALYLKEYPHDVTKNERRVLQDTFYQPDKLSEVYVANDADYTKASMKPEFSSKDYLIAWAKMGMHHPFVYLKAAFAQTNYYYTPFNKSEDFIWCASMASYYKPKFLHLHYLNSSKLRKSVKSFSTFIVSIPFLNVFLNYAIDYWLCLLVSALFVQKYGFKFVIPIIPVFMNWLICIASPVNGMLRYPACVVFATFLIVIYYLFIIKHKLERRK